MLKNSIFFSLKVCCGLFTGNCSVTFMQIKHCVTECWLKNVVAGIKRKLRKGVENFPFT